MHDIPILMLHSVNNQRMNHPMGKLSVSPEGLEEYLKVFQKWGYQMISITELIEGKYDEDKNFIILTFDDGYKDNLMVARPILEKYNAHATIFVNPGYFSEESDPSSNWGFMTWDEVKEAEKSGIFDIQAHTMTHEFIFVSDKIVDYYTPEKFNRYYWLAWILFPESPRRWNSDAYSYRDRIPVGYPIFEYGRRISQNKFIPDQKYIDFLINAYDKGNHTDYKNDIEYNGVYGTYEEETDYRNYVTWEITECKRLLEQQLNKTITTLCFPGGGYNTLVLDIARKNGYKAYIAASKLKDGNNYDHLTNIRKGKFDSLNRISFSLIHPGVLPDVVFDKWVAKLTLGQFQGLPKYTFIKNACSKLVHAIRPQL